MDQWRKNKLSWNNHGLSSSSGDSVSCYPEIFLALIHTIKDVCLLEIPVYCVSQFVSAVRYGFP